MGGVGCGCVEWSVGDVVCGVWVVWSSGGCGVWVVCVMCVECG